MLLVSSASLWSFHTVAKSRASLCKSHTCILVLRPPNRGPRPKAYQVPRCCWIFQQASLVWGPHLSVSGHDPQSVVTYFLDHNLPSSVFLIRRLPQDRASNLRGGVVPSTAQAHHDILKILYPSARLLAPTPWEAAVRCLPYLIFSSIGKGEIPAPSSWEWP